MKIKEQKQKHYVNGNQKRAGMAKLISDKIDFKVKSVTNLDFSVFGIVC